MGAAASTSNIADITNNTTINDQESCQLAQTVVIDNGDTTIMNTTCSGPLNLNQDTISASNNCSFNTQITAVAKTMADQTADSSADSGLPFAADFATANSSNVVNLQNNIEMAVNTSCGAQQNISIHNRSVVLNGDLVEGACNINGTNASANMTCVMDLVQQTDESGSSSQSASASATNTDLGILLLIIAAILIVPILCMLGGKLLFKAIKAPVTAAADAGKGASAASTARLAAARANLAKARAAAAAAPSVPAVPAPVAAPPVAGPWGYGMPPAWGYGGGYGGYGGYGGGSGYGGGGYPVPSMPSMPQMPSMPPSMPSMPSMPPAVPASVAPPPPVAAAAAATVPR